MVDSCLHEIIVLDTVALESDARVRQCPVLLLPENRNTATDSDPEALIEEARQLQRQRTRRRNIQLQITAVLVILGVEIGQLVRGGSSAPPTPQQPQPGAAHVPVVKYEKIVVKKIV